MFKKIFTAAVASALIATLSLPMPAMAASCTPAKQLASKSIKELHAEVVNAETGQTLFSQAEDTPVRTASVMKLLTAAVALDVLGADYRVTTNVYVDPVDNTKIYLVGAGDITLSRMPGNITSYYAKAPKLDTLTRQISSWAKLRGITISQVAIDNSLYGSNDEWHETWSKKGLTQGYMAPVSALQIDAARVTSTKVSNMLKVSDNSLAEAMARLASLKAGYDGSMQSLTPLYKSVLGARGLEVSNIKIVDASGLSILNEVPAAFVTDLVGLIDQQVGQYQVIEAGMPVSGQRGSLKSRFANGNLKAARGLVVAKTGYITSGYTLAGFLTARDGTKLQFTVYNLAEKVGYNNRQAMDNLVYRFYQCGAKLTN
jgi:D-alanyl-D-alanine carboxypeptidase/D-alanyl-D-alanine-endopeptidase (penicillin-binding protein 4)